MRNAVRATILTALIMLSLSTCELFRRFFLPADTGTAELALVWENRGPGTPNGGTLDMGNWSRGYPDATSSYRIVNVGDGPWHAASALTRSKRTYFLNRRVQWSRGCEPKVASLPWRAME